MNSLNSLSIVLGTFTLHSFSSFFMSTGFVRSMYTLPMLLIVLLV